MKVIKTILDTKAYEDAVRQVISENRNTVSLTLDSWMFNHPLEYERAVFQEAQKRVDRSKFETKITYLYLNAVVCDSCPKFIVYNEEEGVRMIDVNDCKIEEDEQRGE